MSAFLLRAAFKVMNDVSEALSETNGLAIDRAFLDRLAEDLSNPVVLFFGHVFHMTGFNPSGNAITSILNSIANDLILRSAYLYHKGFSLPEQMSSGAIDQLLENVYGAYYGDDCIISTRDETFDFHRYQEICAMFGITITPASKDGDTYSFRSQDEVTFLKRRFKPHPVFDDIMLAPISRDTISKMLCVGMRSSVDQIILDQSRLSSALHLVAQEGPEEFARFRLQVLECAENYGIPQPRSGWPSLYSAYSGYLIDGFSLASALSGEEPPVGGCEPMDATLDECQ